METAQNHFLSPLRVLIQLAGSSALTVLGANQSQGPNWVTHQQMISSHLVTSAEDTQTDERRQTAGAVCPRSAALTCFMQRTGVCQMASEPTVTRGRGFMSAARLKSSGILLFSKEHEEKQSGFILKRWQFSLVCLTPHRTELKDVLTSFKLRVTTTFRSLLKAKYLIHKFDQIKSEKMLSLTL